MALKQDTILELDEWRPIPEPQAFDYCERLARAHYENFSVGSWFLPRRIRPHVYNVYAFCRTVDDLGDEALGDRTALLGAWEEDLLRCFGNAEPHHPVHCALRRTIRAFDLPRTPFLKLIEANRRDQSTKRHGTFAELLDYCDHSANPVGRIFLALFGYCDEERAQLSDYTCTALQLANFWQDVARDRATGRVYIPQEDLKRFGVQESDLDAERADERFVNLMRYEVERTDDLFQRGFALVDRVAGPVRLDIELFSRGGVAVLEAIRAQGFDVLARRPSLTRRQKAWMMLSAFMRQRFHRAPRADAKP